MILLKYEDRESQRVRARRLRLLVLLLGVGLLKVVLITVGDRFGRGTMSLFWLQKCQTYRLPQDRVMYLATRQPIDLPPELADFTASSTTWQGTVGARPYPIELVELEKQLAPTSDVPWERLPSPVFLHALKDSRQRTRLVTVWALANNPPGWWTLVATTRRPNNDAARSTVTVLSTACWPMSQDSSTFVVFAGQPDPKDPSCFSLRVRLRGKDQIVTGMLKDDGTIEFKSSTGLIPWSTDRTGPLVMPRLKSAGHVFTSSYDGNDTVLLPVD